MCFLFRTLLLGGRENPVALGENNKPNFDSVVLDTEEVSAKSVNWGHRSNTDLCPQLTDFGESASVLRKTLSKFPILGALRKGFMILQGEDLRSDLKFQHGF